MLSKHFISFLALVATVPLYYVSVGAVPSANTLRIWFPPANAKLKRGRSYDTRWNARVNSDMLFIPEFNIAIVSTAPGAIVGDPVVQSVGATVRKKDFKIPADITPGQYKLRFTNTIDGEDLYESAAFYIIENPSETLTSVTPVTTF